MTAESRTTARIGDQIPDLPERRLLIIRELDDFTTGGIMRWTPELVETFMAWSDFGTRAPGTYRIAFVSQTLTTEQVRGGKNGHAFTDVLQAWNVARHEEDRLKLIVQYGDTSACYLDGKYRNDGSERQHLQHRGSWHGQPQGRSRTAPHLKRPIPGQGEHHVRWRKLRDLGLHSPGILQHVLPTRYAHSILGRDQAHEQRYVDRCHRDARYTLAKG